MTASEHEAAGTGKGIPARTVVAYHPGPMHRRLAWVSLAVLAWTALPVPAAAQETDPPALSPDVPNSEPEPDPVPDVAPVGPSVDDLLGPIGERDGERDDEPAAADERMPAVGGRASARLRRVSPSRPRDGISPVLVLVDDWACLAWHHRAGSPAAWSSVRRMNTTWPWLPRRGSVAAWTAADRVRVRGLPPATNVLLFSAGGFALARSSSRSSPTSTCRRPWTIRRSRRDRARPVGASFAWRF